VGVFLALTAGLVFWIVGWTFGIKAFDAFLVTIFLVLVAVTARIASPFVKEYLKP
jgi:hypothetical protein